MPDEVASTQLYGGEIQNI